MKYKPNSKKVANLVLPTKGYAAIAMLTTGNGEDSLLVRIFKILLTFIFERLFSTFELIRTEMGDVVWLLTLLRFGLVAALSLPGPLSGLPNAIIVPNFNTSFPVILFPALGSVSIKVS